MHCHGVGASAKDSTVLPTRSLQRKAGRGSRASRKNPLRLHTSAKWTTICPVRSASSKLRMSPPRLISMSPPRSASIVGLPKVAAGTAVTSSPASRKWPSATPAARGV